MMKYLTRRIKYLGFDDRWFGFVNVVILSLIIDYLFNNSFVRYDLDRALLNWSISLFFSITNWIIMTETLIALRKRFPALEDLLKRILIFFLLIIVIVVVIDILGGLLLNHMFGGEYNPIQRSKLLVPIILVSVMTMAFYEAIYFFVKLKKSIRDEEHSKQAIVQAQLDGLRNQAQPHFLFNSLNTLRDIIEESPKSDAINFVNKLSDVYRFTLEIGDLNVVPVQKELKFAQSYIHIQQERFGDNLKVNWDIQDSAIHQMIAPMSLQILLENAIKHNVISKSNPLIINVIINDHTLRVQNKIQTKSTQLASTKLGLENIRKRYNLLSEIPIEVLNDGTQFQVSLPLLSPLS